MRRKSITIQLDNDMYQNILKLANENRISVAGQIRLMLAPQLKEQDKCSAISIKDKIK